MFEAPVPIPGHDNQQEGLSSHGARSCSRGLYYALDVNPRVLFQLRCSIHSVRKYAPTLPIYAVIAGQLPAIERRSLESLGVTVIAATLERGTSPTFMKWRGLAKLPPQRDLLYLDTDTLAFDDPTLLFDLCGPEDFHARLEVGCDLEESAYPFLFNVRLFTKSRVDPWLFRKIVEHRRGRLLPIFNTGVMLFRNGLAERLAQHWSAFVRLDRQFRRKQIPYPSVHVHILEEMVAPLVLGSIGPFSWKPLTPQLCPFYLEYRGRHVETHGLILHVWSAYYDSCMFEYMGKECALAYRALPLPPENGGSGLAARIAARRLLLGSMWMRLPKPLLNVWLRMGATPNRPAPVGIGLSGE